MGKVYTRKRHSCALCKPHKMGWSPKLKERQMFLRKVHEAEMRVAR